MTSFLCNFDPGFSTSRRIWVMPALNPAKPVKWQGLDLESFGNERMRPRLLLVRQRGTKPNEP